MQKEVVVVVVQNEVEAVVNIVIKIIKKNQDLAAVHVVVNAEDILDQDEIVLKVNVIEVQHHHRHQQNQVRQ